MTTDLRSYVIAAKRGGPEGIYEDAARHGLRPIQLGYLAEHLREFDVDWRLTKHQRADLIDQLLDAGVAPGRIRQMAGCSKQTVWRRHLRRGPVAQVGVATPDDKRAEGSKKARRDPLPLGRVWASSRTTPACNVSDLHDVFATLDPTEREVFAARLIGLTKLESGE
jgi:DNA-binding transcriptional LysR family regulator